MGKNLSVQVDIMSIIVNIIFTKTYSVTKRNLSEKTFWTFVHVFTLDEKTILTFRYKLKKKDLYQSFNENL